MTIKPRENVQNFSQRKKLFVFNEENGNLRDRAETKLLQVSNVQQKLWKTLLWRAASHRQLPGDHSQYVDESFTGYRKLDNKCKYSTKEKESDTGHVNGASNTYGGNDHLLILAHSAELMMESDSLDGSYGNDSSNEVAQNSSESASLAIVADHTSPGKQIEGLSVVDQMRSKEDGVHGEGRTLHSGQIQHQARLQRNLLLQNRIGESIVGNLQERKARLTQIRNQARSKNHMQKCLFEDSQGRIVRLSEIRRQARVKNNSLVQITIQNNVYQHLDCKTFKGNFLRSNSGKPGRQDHQRKRIIADIFGEEDGSKAEL